jgi:hypothetical protein
MALSEIEKLERRYAENPQGLTFAPLAEVHRKNGETQRALDLLGPGLAIHPDYIPASIVLGRCHLDLGDVHAAEIAFLHVLALDGENVIALKALADISERLLKFDEAERWLHTLLSVDRSNDDAREQLQRVEIARRQAEVASSAEPASVLEPEAGETAAEAEASASAADAGPAPFESPVAEPAMGWVSQSSQAAVTASADFGDLEPSALREPLLEEPAGLEVEEPAGIQLDEPAGYVDEVEPIDGLVGREVDTPGEPDEFRVETSEDIILRSSGGSEFQVPDASQELFAGGALGPRAPFEEDAPVPPPAAERAAPPEPAAWSEPAEPPREPEPEAEPQPMMWGAPAEEPGPSALPDEAPWRPGTAGEEREPAAPEPAAFEPAVAEASAAGVTAELAPQEERLAPEPDPEPETIPEPELDYEHPATTPVAAASAQEAPAPEIPKRTYAASETGGRPVAQLLKDILAARPPAQSAPAPVRQPPAVGSGGAPTRPAADALSLSSVFGDEASETPPAMPAPSQGAGVSFDDFFSTPSASPSTRAARTPDPKNDDLDQFHAWLQNLKR